MGKPRVSDFIDTLLPHGPRIDADTLGRVSHDLITLRLTPQEAALLGWLVLGGVVLTVYGLAALVSSVLSRARLRTWGDA